MKNSSQLEIKKNAYTVKIKKKRFDYASYYILSYRMSGQS